MDSPEHRLWFAILGTWFDDIRRAWWITTIKSLRRQMDNQWTRHICKLLDLEYSVVMGWADVVVERRIPVVRKCEEMEWEKRMLTDEMLSTGTGTTAWPALRGRISQIQREITRYKRENNETRKACMDNDVDESEDDMSDTGDWAD